jgi:hypothetical protein
MARAGYFETRRMKKVQSELSREQEEDAEMLHKQSGYQTRELQRLEARQRIIERKEQKLSLKQKERELTQKEREFAHPVRTRAIRRAEKMANLGATTVKQIPAKATMEGARRLRQTASRVRVTPTTRRLPREKPGRTRLPVFQEGVPNMGERIAMDFGMKPVPDILPAQQQQEIVSRPADPFGTNKQYDLGLGNKQYDLGIGSSNGDKKKKGVRYY